MVDGEQARRSGWESDLGELVAAQPDAVVAALRGFILDASGEQVEAWNRSVKILQVDGQHVIARDSSTAGHGTILEYLMPREGGRRPDVILLPTTPPDTNASNNARRNPVWPDATTSKPLSI